MSGRKENFDSMDEGDLYTVTPLGAGQEVGRSCIVVDFKGKKVMFDCGIHPGLSGLDALPFVDCVETDQIDILLITHFHLDHCGALPWFLLKTNFKGRCYMTHATKAIYRCLLSDYIKVSNFSTGRLLFSESDLEASMDKIYTISLHEEKEVSGIKFWAYNAGHVLGAAMFMIEISGVKLLYTGDFSRQEDRHLMAAEIPPERPDILITESTYGTHIHEKREDREARFTTLVHDIVNRGGRCLIPVFALGRAQELLLILDEYWSEHPELHDVPIYYASSLAKKCMTVYQTYINAMNDRIKRQIAFNNPFVFSHISYLKGIDSFEDVGPCVVLASPGMMQSGLSRELFETWCPGPKNGVIIAGYCVEGTMAKAILSEPSEITALNGQKLKLSCSVSYISFSAHTDFEQTSEFIKELKPKKIVLVHGEQNEMKRLKTALLREYEDDPRGKIEVYNPRNTEAVKLYFKGEKVAKVIGTLASAEPKPGDKITGMLVRREFSHHIVSPSDVSKYMHLSMMKVKQTQLVPFYGCLVSLRGMLAHIASPLLKIESETLKAFDCIELRISDKKMVSMDWLSDPVSDMYADTILATLLMYGKDVQSIMTSVKLEKPDFKECVLAMLSDMFGRRSVPREITGNKFRIYVGKSTAYIDLSTYEVFCKSDATLQEVVMNAIGKLYLSLNPAIPSY